MFSNRCFYESVGDLRKVAYVMFNTFRLNYNTAIYEGIKLREKGSDFRCFIYHISENPFQDAFFEEGVQNFEEIEEVQIKKIDLLEELLKELVFYDTIFLDQPYLKEEKELAQRIQNINRNIVFVEHNVSVPVRISSQKEEYNARTIRPKIWRNFKDYRMNYPRVQDVFNFEKKAKEVFLKFAKEKLPFYELRNDPSLDYQSHMSKYLKYGFISVNEMYEILEPYNSVAVDTYLEELIIRRELAFNFVYYNSRYDAFDSMTYDWAYQTMAAHLEDPREYIYSISDYINIKTHDRFFNAAMKEMLFTHDMHGYMRMYWAKKILEWSNSYEEAYNTILQLNNSLFLDGNTPNGYMNVAWIFGKHDRAWFERPVFGKLRYMNANGLRRKFDIEKYVERMEGFDVSKT